MEKKDAEVLLEHAAFVRALSRRLVRDESKADDVAQQTMLAALQHPPRQEPRSWLGTVVRNVVRRMVRTERRRLRRELAAARTERVGSTADRVTREELLRSLTDAVFALPEHYREAILMRFYEDLPPRQIAKELKIPVETVRSRVQRGVAKLRDLLDKKHGGRSAWMLGLAMFAFPRRTGATTTGVAFMSTKTKISIAAALLLFASGVTLTLLLSSAHTQSNDPRSTAVREPQAFPEDQHVDSEENASIVRPDDRLGSVDRDLDLHGIVVNSDGAPVPGADLEAAYYPWGRANVVAFRFDEYRAGPKTRSASDGTFKLRLRRGDSVGLRARAEGFAPVELSLLQAGERVRVVLSAGVSVEVAVHDARGQPIAGAQVLVFLREAEKRNYLKANGNGVATLHDLPAGATVYIAAMHPLYAAPRGTSPTLPTEGHMEHVIELGDGKMFTGRVTDARSGDPIKNARVGKSWTLKPDTRTNDEGLYRLNAWIGPNWHHAIYVLAPGYASGHAVAGAETTIDFALELGVAVTGRVLGADGQPIGGAHVSALGEKGRAIISRAHTTTAGDGRFRLADLNRDIVHVLVVIVAGHGRILLDFKPDKEDLGDIELPRPRAIEGVVVDEHDNPLARVGITLLGDNKDRRDRSRHAMPGPMFYGRNEKRNTDDLGRFRFPDLAPGQYRLFCRFKGRTTTSRNVSLGKDDVLDVRILVQRGRPFLVKVVDDRGDPVQRARVEVTHEQGRSYGTTDEHGKVELIVVGKVRFVNPPSASSDSADYGPVERIENPAGDEAHFTLPRWESIRGKVVDQKGMPVGGIQVTVFAGGKELGSTSSALGGEFRAGVPPRSVVDLVVTGQHVENAGLGVTTLVQTYKGRLDGVAAGRKDITLRIEQIRRNRTLRVRVLTPEGKPLEGARVYYSPAPLKGGLKTTATSASGWATLKDLPSAKVSVHAFVDRGLPFIPPQPIELVPNGQDVTLRCRAGALVDGTVTLPDGKPAKGAMVFLMCENQTYTAITSADGSFQCAVPDVPGEVWTYLLVEGKPRFTTTRQAYEPGAGTVELKLKAID